MCHAHCRDLLHLDYPQNGKWPSCRSASEVRHSSRRNGQVGRRVNCSCSIQDVEKEKETHNYLSKEEIKEKVHKYNLAVTDKLKMTLNSNGIYTGFIKVQMELCKPAQTPANPSSSGCMNTLHISSTNTVGDVIDALLKKFQVTESPTKFALYKRCHREDQVYACKLSDREHPLYLRLVAGPRTDTLSFVLREHEIGEWEAFSLLFCSSLQIREWREGCSVLLEGPYSRSVSSLDRLLLFINSQGIVNMVTPDGIVWKFQGAPALCLSMNRAFDGESVPSRWLVPAPDLSEMSPRGRQIQVWVMLRKLLRQSDLLSY